MYTSFPACQAFSSWFSHGLNLGGSSPSYMGIALKEFVEFSPYLCSPLTWIGQQVGQHSLYRGMLLLRNQIFLNPKCFLKVPNEILEETSAVESEAAAMVNIPNFQVKTLNLMLEVPIRAVSQKDF